VGRIRIGLGVLATAVALAVASAPARAARYPDCAAAADQQHAGLVKLSRSSVEHVTIPGQNGVLYAADVFAPQPLPTQRLAAPGAVVMHGIDANPCSVRWLARLLAGRGYFVVSPYRPPTTDPAQHADDVAEAKKHMAAERAGYEYLRSAAFPFSGFVSPDDISLVGHSLGASAAAVLQGEHLDGVRTIVALDGLRRYGAHDRGLPFNCTGKPGLPIKPVVPALGLASEAVCSASPHPHDHELRKTGYRRWRQARVASVVTALKGFQHTSFTGSGNGPQLKRVAHIVMPWLDHYQRGASASPLATFPTNWLSHKFLSAAYLPDEGIDCPQLTSCP
jgi:pimeloyl-ACP methyl ester carboxylesterase